MNICIIPARSGSERIKKKNIKKFFGKPIIYYPIKEAIKSKLFKKIIVSTDSDEIINISRNFGAETSKRSKELSKNNVSTQKIIKNEIIQLEKKGLQTHNVCCIYPTAVLLKSYHLKKSFSAFKKFKKSFLFSAQKFTSPPQRALIRQKGNIYMMNSKNYFMQSNNLKETYYDAGQFYWGDANSWINEKIVFGKKSDIYVLSFLDAVDINNKEDWKLAEFLYKNR